MRAIESREDQLKRRIDSHTLVDNGNRHIAHSGEALEFSEISAEETPRPIIVSDIGPIEKNIHD